MEYNVIPAVLEYDSLAADQRIRTAQELGDIIHVDVIDQSFGQASFCTPEFLAQYTPHTGIELHMMVTDPIIHINPYAQVGIKRFIGHVEHMSDPLLFAQQVKQIEKEVFLGIDFDTPIEQYLSNQALMSLLNGFTIMTIHAGSSGQSFEVAMLEKVKKIRAQYPQFHIEVDGGINLDTARAAKEAGANLFCVNSFIFKSGNPKEAFENLSISLSSRAQ